MMIQKYNQKEISKKSIVNSIKEQIFFKHSNTISLREKKDQ